MSNSFMHIRNGVNFASAASDPASANTGDVYYSTSTNTLRFYNGSTWSDIGSGATNVSGTGKNYLSSLVTSNGTNNGNGDFELGTTTGWSLGNSSLTSNFPSGTPTFGSGASGNLSFSVVSSGQLAGSYSGSYASSAATTAGNFLASNAFYIDTEDQSKILNISFYYYAQSGASNINFSGTSSSSYGVAIYDVTNSAWIQPTTIWGLTQSGAVGYVTSTFQTTSNSTQYRLVLYNANATSGAATLYVDSFSVSPQISVIGSVVTDWVAYTPTFTGLGTVSSSAVYSRRVGGELEVRGAVVAGTTAASAASVTIGFAGSNSNVSINSSIIGSEQPFGRWGTTNANYVSGEMSYISSSTAVGFDQTLINLSGATVAAASLQQTNGSSMGGTNVNIQFWFTVPIVGWSSNVQVSPPVGAPVVACSGALSGAQSISNSSQTIVQFSSLYEDTVGAFNTGTYTYTVKVSGYYDMFASLEYAINATNLREIYIFVNGTSIADGGIQGSSTANATATARAIRYLTAGSTIVFQTLQNSGGSLSLDASVGTYFTISMVPSMAATYNAVFAPNVQVLTSGSGTYTTPTNSAGNLPLYLVVELCGGGGGAGGGGENGTGQSNGTSGNSTTFGTSLLTATGGTHGGTVGSGLAAGGTATVNSPAMSIYAYTGGAGGSGGSIATNGWGLAGADGGYTYLGGGGKGGPEGTGSGGNGVANTGGGGGGGGVGPNSATICYTGAGGASGGYIKAQINNPATSYPYSVAASVAGGSAGTNGGAGGAGGSGVIIVTANWQ